MHIILENLKYIDATGKNIEIRIPYIPEYNAEELKKMGVSKSTNTKKIKELVIPSSVEFIENYAFDGWSGRQKIILDWPSTEYKKLEGLKGIDAKVYYNDGKRYKYKK